MNTELLINFPLSDAGNAERLEVLIGENWRYVSEIKSWLHFTGKRWQEDTPEVLAVAAIEGYRKLQDAIFAMPAPTDKAERKRREMLTNWLERSENANKLQAAIKILQGVLKASYSIFDNNAHLLNLQNGTLNLKTLKLQPHDKKDYLTKIGGAAYVDFPVNSLWIRTVKEILPDSEIRNFVQRFTGYCLTASTEEEKFIVACGPGGCGKGTFFETIAAALGDYKETLPIDVLLSSGVYGTGNGPTPELAKLPGKRIVLSSESGKGRKLDEAKVKLLTGGDTITARRLHAEPFEFKPAFKLVFQTNYLPSLADSLDNGIRRRMVVIPFNSTISKRNTKLKQELLKPENLSECLWWLVDGLRAWQGAGLGHVPAAAAAAAEEFYHDNDVFQQWLDERTEASNGALLLTKAYEDFCDWLYGGKKYSRITFGAAIREHGVKTKRNGKGIVFENIALRVM